MRPYTCTRCRKPSEAADKGKLPKLCVDCRMLETRRQKAARFARYLVRHPERNRLRREMAG